jgi:hypothetical protein
MIPLQRAVNQTTDVLLNKLLEIVDDSVYSNSPEWYTRTGGFRDSWQKKNGAITGISCQSEIYQNISAMVWGQELFQHGNIYTPLEGNALADILNDGTDAAGFGFSPVEATHFWDMFIEWVNTNLDDIFVTNCYANGLVVNKGMVAII